MPVTFSREQFDALTDDQSKALDAGVPLTFSREDIENDSPALQLAGAMMDTTPEPWDQYIHSKLPFIGSVVNTFEDLSVLDSTQKMEQGEADEADYLKVANHMRRLQDSGDRGALQKFGDLVVSIPGFATEFMATTGAYSGAKKLLAEGGEAVLQRALEKKTAKEVMRRVPGHMLLLKSGQAVGPRAGGVAAQTAANPQLVAGNIVDRLLPQVGIGQNEAGALETIIEKGDESLAESVGMGTLDAMIEMGSERAGFLVTRAPFVKGLKAAIAKRYLSRAGATLPALKQTLKRAGWNGAIAEVFEERVGDAARGVTGVGDDYGTLGQLASLDPEGFKQLAIEALAFSVPGMASMTLSQGQARQQELQDILAKGYVAEADGIEGANRKERWAAANAELNILQEEIGRATQPADPLPQIEGPQPGSATSDVAPGPTQPAEPAEPAEEPQPKSDTGTFSGSETVQDQEKPSKPEPDAAQDAAPDAAQEPTPAPQVGQFARGKWNKPRKITGVSEDGQFVFVEGSEAGIPAAEIEAVDEAEVILDELKTEARKEVRDWERRTRRRGGRLADASIAGLQREADKARKLLGLRMKDDMSPEAIDKAVRRASLEAHPDLGGSQEQQAAVNEAGELLRNSPGVLKLAKHLWEQRQKPKAPAAPAKPAEPKPEPKPEPTKPEALESPPKPRGRRDDRPKSVGAGVAPRKGLVVANVGANGKVYYGKPGQNHGDLSVDYGKQVRKEAGLKPGEATWTMVGFAGPSGRVLSREEALKVVKEEGPFRSSIPGELDASDLREQRPGAEMPKSRGRKDQRPTKPKGRSDARWDADLGKWVSPSSQMVFDPKHNGWRLMTPDEGYKPQETGRQAGIEPEGRGPGTTTPPPAQKEVRSPEPADDKAAADEAAQKESEETGKPVDAQVDGLQVEQVPVSSVKADPSRFQFKGGIDKKGVQDPIEGEFDPFAAGIVTLWEDKSGQRFVVNGHHRFDLAQRAGVENIQAFVLKESDGITANHAKMMGAELNIKEGQGTIDDYATFFRESGIEEAEAKSRGLLARSKGQSGFLIGKFATDDVYHAFRSGQVTAEVAATIADVGRGNEAVQNLGLAKAKSKRNPKGMPASQLREFLALTLKAPKPKSRGKQPKQGDLFGFDDTAIQEAEEMSKVASRIINEKRDRIRAVQGALRRPDKAKEMGLSGDMEAIQAEVSKLQEELAEWDNWTTDPKLTAQVREEAGLKEEKTGQSAIPGFEEEAASVEKGEEKKRAKEKRKDDAPPPGKQEDLFSKKGLAGQKNLFPDKGVPDDLVGNKKKKKRRPSGDAMAAMTEGDSYQPVGTEGSKPPPAKPASRGKAKSDAKKVIDDLVGIASPAHVDDVTREFGHIARSEMSRAAKWSEEASAALHRWERKFILMSPEDSYAFIDNLEAGKKQATQELNDIADAIREQLDKGRDRLQQIGKLQEFYENYFPHMWKNPEHAEGVIRSISAGKPWKSGGFLKRRTHITHKEGRDAGLEPVSDSPIEMSILRLHQINKYISRHNTMQRMKQAGMMKFVPESLDKSYMPAGYEFYDDPAFRVETDPSITMEEAYDKLLVDQLSAVLSRLGVNHQRVAKMSHGKWGVSQGKGIKTRFAGPVSVLAHELGHQIGDKWGLFDYLTKGDPVTGELHLKGKYAGQENKADARRKRSQMQRELRNLADLRVEAQSEEVVERSKGYRRKAAEKEAVILEAWLAAPEKMAEVAPMVTEAWKNFLAANEAIEPLLNLDRSVVLGTREQVIPQKGVLTLGKWAMPTEVARMVRNMLSPGLRSNPNRAIKGLYRLGRVAGNALNQASLSLSGFHGLNVLTDATSTQFGLGLQQMEQGKVGRAVWNMVASPGAGVVGMVQGGQLIKAMRSDLELLSPEMRAFVENAITAGARASMDPVYHNYAIRGLAQSVRKLRYGSAVKKLDASVRMPIQTILGALELTAKPIMEWMVPRMKLYAFMRLSEDVFARANREGLNDFQIREQLTQSWDSVDNRLGQLAYDNLFWNGLLKDSSMLAVRSVGWNLGSFREFGGAIVDVATTRERIRRGDQLISRKIGYAVGAAVTYSTIGALAMYAMTGDWPDEPKDYFFPKTGKSNPDGSPERLSLPTYAKDWIAWTTRPLTVAKHKLHPMWGTMADVFTNENYYGVKIRNEDDPWYTQMSDAMLHVLEAFKPFSLKNLKRFQEAGEDPALAYAMAFSGITSAPAYISRSPAQKLAYEQMIGNIPQGSRTSEQAEASQKRKEIVKRLRENGTVTEEEIKQYSKRQLDLIAKEAKKTPFQVVVGRLHDEQAMKVWNIASDKEKSQIREALSYKFIRQMTEKAESANELDKLAQARMYLDQLGTSTWEDSQKLLMDYYWQPTKDGKLGSERTQDDAFRVGYKRAAENLDDLYGKAEGSYKTWRKEAGFTGQERKKKRASRSI